MRKLWPRNNDDGSKFEWKWLQCERFIYDGCGPKDNLYNSESECFRTCFHNDHSTGAGIARARGLSVINKEQDVNYRVELVEVDSEEDICSLPPSNISAIEINISNQFLTYFNVVEPRPFACSGYMPKWTFDRTLGSCRSYVYGGCGATKNLFDTEEACQAKCANLVKEPSACKFYFNKVPTNLRRIPEFRIA